METLSVSPYYELYDLLLTADNVVKVKADIQKGIPDSFTVLKSYKGIFSEGEHIDNVAPLERIGFKNGGKYLFFLSNNLPLSDEYHHIFPDAILDVRAMKASTKYGDELFSEYKSFSSLEKAIRNFDKLHVIFVDRLSDTRFSRGREYEIRAFCSPTEANITGILDRDFTYHDHSFTSYYVFFTAEGEKEYVVSLNTCPDMGDARAYMYYENGHVFGTLCQ